MMIVSVYANDLSVVDLHERLGKIKSFHAKFVQQVVTSNNKVLLENNGTFWVKRPNLFNWHTVGPEENFLISDGITLWFYIPAIKQVTAYWLTDITDNIFFLLFFDDKLSKWNHFNVLNQDDVFILVPTCNNFNFKKCVIEITASGVLKSFRVFEKSGQYINYIFLNQVSNIIDINKFYFFLDKEIQLDDQRLWSYIR
ncbi:outer membrane lipoprotein chaperone LolA [Candidatus Blochmannia ocreatus (nom. nud.)]|uniref:Outer-membrane lipoprotein carrier protein n=1 Tax=Candidatus Blochmannia ocreatus (nom. nud.) TaxID=251538 RepID=A0ABY4SU85_9ENTR|nr:outer membrane lipoprotein chaperone LolA [Candidatus Blochmannia ocreatus]URJ24892.1 outer membrane lipoprotein chaperone LolA [Candidatus Blochmannia ocreatus]